MGILTLNDQVRSEKMREMTRVKDIGQFISEHRLRWVVGVKRMSEHNWNDGSKGDLI